MTVRSLISVGFLVLPVAVTLGVLLGLQAYRSSQGLPPPFVSNAISTTTYCQRAFGIHPDSDGQEYTLNPNQWGIPEGYTGPGGLCLNVTTHDNNTYATNTTAPEWSITWQYPRGPPTQPVHAFPNIKIDDEGLFPMEISQVASIHFETEWHYGVGDQKPNDTDLAALLGPDVEMNANVAIDMFLDSDPSKATDTEEATYEVMIWLAQFGASTQQIGLAEGAIATQVINGVTFSLYSGVNGLGQHVLTWVASEAVQTFDADLGPLLYGMTGLGGPSTTDYLGYMSFGSETLDAQSNVTFYNPTLNMHIVQL